MDRRSGREGNLIQRSTLSDISNEMDSSHVSLYYLFLLLLLLLLSQPYYVSWTTGNRRGRGSQTGEEDWEGVTTTTSTTCWPLPLPWLFFFYSDGGGNDIGKILSACKTAYEQLFLLISLTSLAYFTQA